MVRIPTNDIKGLEGLVEVLPMEIDADWVLEQIKWSLDSFLAVYREKKNETLLSIQEQKF